MRTLLFIVGGIIIWMIILGITRVIGSHTSNSWLPTIIFGVVWFVIAGWNMWIGISQAGYSFAEELPIFLLIYLLPIATALIAKYKVLP